MASKQEKILRRKIGDYVLSLQGVEKVRIKQNGAVEAFGDFPNAIGIGWYFVGYVTDLETLIAIENGV